MKKLIVLCLSFLMTVLISISVFATDNNLEELTDSIVTTVNDLLNEKLSREVTATDVDFDNAFKIYVGVNVFKIDTTNIDELRGAFGDNDYIYEVPIYIDGDTILVNLSKGQPLDTSVEFTDEERQEILANIGKWQITAVKYYPNEIVNYTTEISEKIGEIPEGTIFIGGLPRFRYAVALLPNENGDVQGLVPLSKIPGEENLSIFQSDSNKKVYNYVQIRQYINQLPPPSQNEAGGFGFLDVESLAKNKDVSYELIIMSVAGMISIAFVVYRKKIKMN